MPSFFVSDCISWMMRVWMDAALQDPELRSEVAPPLDWGRRTIARYLLPAWRPSLLILSCMVVTAIRPSVSS